MVAINTSETFRATLPPDIQATDLEIQVALKTAAKMKQRDEFRRLLHSKGIDASDADMADALSTASALHEVESKSLTKDWGNEFVDTIGDMIGDANQKIAALSEDTVKRLEVMKDQFSRSQVDLEATTSDKFEEIKNLLSQQFSSISSDVERRMSAIEANVAGLYAALDEIRKLAMEKLVTPIEFSPKMPDLKAQVVNHNHMPEVVMPEIKMPEIVMPEIKIPEAKAQVVITQPTRVRKSLRFSDGKTATSEEEIVER